MIKFPSLADKALERILELSADLQIKRRATAPGCRVFRDFSAEIAAYGQVLEVLTTLQREEESSTAAGFFSTLKSPQPPPAII
jgi:hypothetical protein